MNVNENLFNALKTVYGKGSKLGLDDEVIGTVAALKGSAEMNEEQIAAFVAAAEPIFKREQSVADRERTKLHALKKEWEEKYAELEAKLYGNQPDPDAKPTEPQGVDIDALLERLTAAIDAKLNPLQEELAGFKAAKAKEDAVAALDNFVNGWDYAGGFPQERDLAKRVAMKVYRAGGEKMTGDELIAAFREEFDPAVKAKGVTDFTKPFKSDGGGQTKPDFSDELEILNREGIKLPE